MKWWSNGEYGAQAIELMVAELIGRDVRLSGSGVQGRDDEQAEAEIDVRRQPALEAPVARVVVALADPEPGQPEDQQCADGVDY